MRAATAKVAKRGEDLVRYGLIRLPRTGGARLLVLSVLVGIVAVGAYAFTASNTVAAHKSGAGVGAITGYTVESPSNYVYSADGTTVNGVTFDLNAAASDVQVALTATPVHDDWADCGASATEVGGDASPNEVVCDLTSSPNGAVPVANAVDLNVIAVSSGTVTIAP
jgi:hypothetical protein